ncbi:MAG: hypothetical protein JRJ84_09605 [Deltaproteobacteria bacterium]|nr:hypothetical protein [Deltaproteobacteria bacterium]
MRCIVLISLALLVGCTEYDIDGNPDDVNPPIGPAPDIKVDPLSLSWGVKLPGCPSAAKTVTISNVGEEDLEVEEIRLAGDGSAYTLTAAPRTLAPGDAMEASVEFIAGTTIEYLAEIEVLSNDPDEELVAVDMSGEGGDNPTNEDIFDQSTPTKVDVLWVLDNSCSMSDTVTDLELAFDDFIGNFVTLGLDYQIGVTTTDMDDPTMQGRLQGPTLVMASATMSQSDIVQAFDDAVEPDATGSANEKALGAAYAALESPGYALSQGLVRQGANLAVIVVGDEDDQSSMSASQYVSWMDAYKLDPDMTTVSGLVPSGQNLFDPNGCVDPMSVPKLIDVIDETGGLRTPLCDLDFDEVMQWLSFTAAGLQTEFPLSGTPATGAVGIRVTVDGNSVSYDPLGANGWTYNWQTNTVVFHGQTIPGPGLTVVITYPVEGSC